MATGSAESSTSRSDIEPRELSTSLPQFDTPNGLLDLYDVNRYQNLDTAAVLVSQSRNMESLGNQQSRHKFSSGLSCCRSLPKRKYLSQLREKIRLQSEDASYSSALFALTFFLHRIPKRLRQGFCISGKFNLDRFSAICLSN